MNICAPHRKIRCFKYRFFEKGFKVFVALCLFTMASAPALADSYKILAFGDSLTAGLGLAEGQAYPQLIEQKLQAKGYDVTMVNAGVSGETTTGGLARLDWTLKHEPDLVILALGANDALRFIDPALVAENLDRMISRIKARNIGLLLVGMYAPRNLGEKYISAFDVIYKNLAEKYDVPLYPFILDGVVADPALNQGDGLHPNAKGAEIIADKLLPFVEPFLNNTAE